MLCVCWCVRLCVCVCVCCVCKLLQVSFLWLASRDWRCVCDIVFILAKEFPYPIVRPFRSIAFAHSVDYGGRCCSLARSPLLLTRTSSLRYSSGTCFGRGGRLRPLFIMFRLTMASRPCERAARE